ncbi:hypothetical protein, partial [Bordetella parapertussis]|uniref:hypothetical protein n=1 Tax=Bordetella parapertussis TaxID=519 RepID=UPI00396CD44D
MRNVVVLPAPLGPSRPKISPRRTLNEVLATAVDAPNLRTRSWTSMAGWAASGASLARGAGGTGRGAA